MARTVHKRNRSARPIKPLNIFILGDLGAGKGTQSQLLQQSLPLYEIDMGIEQEKQRRTDAVLDKIYRRTVDLGKLAPTTVYRRLVRIAIARVPKTQGIIFAGHPKMPDEVRYVHRLLKRLGRTRSIAVYITIPWKETVRRNSSRKGYFGDKKRADDSLEAIKMRRFNAQASLRASRAVYKELYPYTQISGMGTVSDVQNRVSAALKRLAKKVV
ncbi:MAG: nucleoside monophosphate kinase [Candidatus Doudnabacteria bacterium]|nr:nucleoside monophosphate kinase [Candidatus Doudnabacteria bacterium]